MDIGEKLKQLRKERHMTAEELAKIVGISREHLSGVENNLKPVSLSTLTKICDALGISLYDLFSQDNPQDILTKEQKELLDIVKNLSDVQLRHLNAFLKSLHNDV